MTDQPSFLASLIKKVVVGTLVGAVLVGAAWKLEFPEVFLKMFAAYVLLGTAVFVLLDAPAMKPLSGLKALAGLLAFYAVLCVAYIVGASAWPQYDPEDEKGKIEKLLKVKREKAAQERTLVDESLKRAAALEEKALALAARLNRLPPYRRPSRLRAAGACSRAAWRSTSCTSATTVTRSEARGASRSGAPCSTTSATS